MLDLFTIRAPQMDAMHRASQLCWMELRLAELFPSFAAEPPARRKHMIKDGLARATGYRLQNEDQFAFLCFEQTFGAGCTEQPDYTWARQILNQSMSESGQRIRLLKKAALRRLLDEEEQQTAAAAAANASAENSGNEAEEQE